MHRLLTIALAFVLTTGAAYAQSGNTATVTQADGSSATVDQTVRETGALPTPGNHTVLDQNASTATVLQDGEGNVIGGDPGSVPPVAVPPASPFTQTGGSVLDAKQYGSRNAIHGSQAGGSTADVDQNNTTFPNGEGNALELTQADGADAVVFQRTGYDGGYYGGNEAYIVQSGGPANYVNSSQEGDRNVVDVEQMNGDGNDVLVVQQGLGVQAYVVQDGADNYVNSFGRLYGAYLDVEQSGTLNEVWMHQNEEGVGDDGAEAHITQTGSGHRVGSSAGDFVQGGASLLLVDQSGELQSVTGAQSTSTAQITQSGLDGDASGATNRVLLDQTDALGGGGGSHGAVVYQNGDNNLADIFQQGDHYTNVSQTGTGNTATVSQD